MFKFMIPTEKLGRDLEHLRAKGATIEALSSPSTLGVLGPWGKEQSSFKTVMGVTTIKQLGNRLGGCRLVFKYIPKLRRKK